MVSRPSRASECLAEAKNRPKTGCGFGFGGWYKHCQEKHRDRHQVLYAGSLEMMGPFFFVAAIIHRPGVSSRWSRRKDPGAPAEGTDEAASQRRIMSAHLSYRIPFSP